MCVAFVCAGCVVGVAVAVAVGGGGCAAGARRQSVQAIFDAYKGKEHRLRRGLEKKYGEVFIEHLSKQQ